MSDPRPFRPWPDLAAAVAVVGAATAPVWRMGWLRDDWLLLWRTLDPATAPAGAGGVFPRPVAALLWRGAAALAGDAPWGMHLLVVLAWVALVAGALRWHRRHGGGDAAAWLVAAVLAAHGALVEPRLWAAAGNGVLAAALGVWGAWLLRPGTARGARAAGAGLMLLAVLARADAVLLLVLPLARPAGTARRPRWALPGLAVLGVALLAWMVAGGGGWSVRPADGGRLLRLLLLPWGPPLPHSAAVVLGIGGGLLALGAGRLLLTAAPRAGAFLLTAGLTAAAGSLVDWSAAGRYVLMPAVALALAVGAWWEGAGRANLPRGLGRGLRLAVVAWLAVSALALVRGRTGADLQARSAVETGLYRAVRAELPLPGDRLTVLNAPPLGWTDAAADAENVVSAAARRPLTVVLGPGDAHSVAFPAAVWRQGGWLVWTGREVERTQRPGGE